jgi:hypothetical protein
MKRKEGGKTPPHAGPVKVMTVRRSVSLCARASFDDLPVAEAQPDSGLSHRQ